MAYAPDPLLKCVLPPEKRSYFYFIISAEHSLSAQSHKFPPLELPRPFLSFSQYNHSNLYAFSPAPLPSFSSLPPCCLPHPLSLPHSQCMNEFQFIQLHEPPRIARGKSTFYRSWGQYYLLKFFLISTRISSF